MANESADLSIQKLLELGIPMEIAQKIADGTIPAVNTHAEGGKGGHSVSLTYIDNYSSLLLVYTFLLQLMDNDSNKWKKNTETNETNRALLQTLQTAMKEQQEYKKAFLEAVRSLDHK